MLQILDRVAVDLRVALLLALVLAGIVGHREFSIREAGFGALELDEELYLPSALDTFRMRPSAGYYWETPPSSSILEVLGDRPNAVTDLLVGGIASGLHLPMETLDALLDVTSVFLCSISLFLLFKRMSDSLLASSVATTLFLFLPSVFTSNSHRSIFSWLLPGFSPSDFVENVVAFDRAVFTQVGCVISSFLLYKAANALQRAGDKRLEWSLIGILAGMLVHVYFFYWIAAAFLINAMIVSYRLSGTPVPTAAWVLFNGWLALASIPGVFLLVVNSTGGIVSAPEISEYFYLPIWKLIELGVCLVILLRVSSKRLGSDLSDTGQLRSRRLVQVFALLTACTLGEILCMNLQPTLAEGIAPYRFARFFFQPLYSGLLCILVHSWAEARSYRLFASAWSIGLISFTVFFHTFGFWPSQKDERGSAYRELARY